MSMGMSEGAAGGSRERLVVIGGDPPGLCPASQAPRLKGPAEREIVAVERGPMNKKKHKNKP
ncbi:hypothetical protein ACFU2J_31825, partial [Streptomyces sp. NPDC057387]